jgi:hypothetical protein
MKSISITLMLCISFGIIHQSNAQTCDTETRKLEEMKKNHLKFSDEMLLKMKQRDPYLTNIIKAQKSGNSKNIAAAQNQLNQFDVQSGIAIYANVNNKWINDIEVQKKKQELICNREAAAKGATINSNQAGSVSKTSSNAGKTSIPANHNVIAPPPSRPPSSGIMPPKPNRPSAAVVAPSGSASPATNSTAPQSTSVSAPSASVPPASSASSSKPAAASAPSGIMNPGNNTTAPPSTSPASGVMSPKPTAPAATSVSSSFGTAPAAAPANDINNKKKKDAEFKKKDDEYKDEYKKAGKVKKAWMALSKANQDDPAFIMSGSVPILKEDFKKACISYQGIENYNFVDTWLKQRQLKGVSKELSQAIYKRFRLGEKPAGFGFDDPQVDLRPPMMNIGTNELKLVNIDNDTQGYVSFNTYEQIYQQIMQLMRYDTYKRWRDAVERNER